MQTTADEFEEAVAASSAAGYAGMSVWTLYASMVPDTKAILDEHGLSGRFVEGVFGWANNPDRDAVREELDAALALARETGASEIQAVTLDPEIEDLGATIERFRLVCDRAADDGVGLALEFLPWTGIPDLATAWTIVEGADRDNAGICFDTWHWVRQPGGPAPELLRSIPGDKIRLFQVCDVAPEPTADAMTECTTDRRLLGEGVLDLAEVLAIFDEIGADPIVSPEIFSIELLSEGKHAMAEKVHDSTLAALG